MENILMKTGLSRQEAKIYLSLLRLGMSSASKVAQETDTDRATTYRFLTSLINKGLVSCVITNNIKYFIPADPKKILFDLIETKNEYKAHLPKLLALTKLPTEGTTVELYRGKEGLKTVMKDILKEKKNYTFFGEVEKFFTEMPYSVFHWIKNIEKSNIKGRLICRENSKFQIAKTETYRIISDRFISNISTWTYGNKTAFFIWSTPLFAIVVHNKDVTESTLQVFEYMWKLSKRPSAAHIKKHSMKTKRPKNL